MLRLHRIHVIDAPDAPTLKHDEADLRPLVEFGDHLICHEIGRQPEQGAALCKIEIAGHLRNATPMIHRVTQLLAQAQALVKELDHDTIVAVQLCAELEKPLIAPEGSTLASLLDERGMLNELGYTVAALL